MLIPITPQKKEKKLGKRRKKAIVLKKTLMNLNAPLERKGKWVVPLALALIMESGFGRNVKVEKRNVEVEKRMKPDDHNILTREGKRLQFKRR